MGHLIRYIYTDSFLISVAPPEGTGHNYLEMLTPTLNKRASSIFSTVLAVGRPKNLSTGGLLPPSPVPHLLVSNSPPSEEERDAIKATLVAVKKTYDCWKDSEGILCFN